MCVCACLFLILSMVDPLSFKGSLKGFRRDFEVGVKIGFRLGLELGGVGGMVRVRG